MFTGIVQGVATVATLADKPGLRTFKLAFPPGFTDELSVGASVSVDGVCLTVTNLKERDTAEFDVMLQSLSLTTLAGVRTGHRVNVERAAREGAEVGGHPLSGHIDFSASIASMRTPQNNHVLRIEVAAPWMRYLFAKGYVAVNGASLTLAQIHRGSDGSGWFEVWLIPETLRMTTFAEKKVGAEVNVEVDRQTQIIVNTIRDAINSRLSTLQSAIETVVDAASMAPRLLRHLPDASLSIGGLGEMATAKRKKTKSGKLKPHADDNQGPHAMRPMTDDNQGPHAMRPMTDDNQGPHTRSPKKKKKSAKKAPKKKK